VGRYRLDIADPRAKTDIECDGYPFSHTDKSHDRMRDRFLRKAGWTIIRLRVRRQQDAKIYDLSRLVKLLKGRK
jgi:very-short-patch-repair endonuclease